MKIICTFLYMKTILYARALPHQPLKNCTLDASLFEVSKIVPSGGRFSICMVALGRFFDWFCLWGVPFLIILVPWGGFFDGFGRWGRLGPTLGHREASWRCPADVTPTRPALFWWKMSLQGSIFGSQENQKSTQHQTFEARSALRPSKNDLRKGVRIKHEKM